MKTKVSIIIPVYNVEEYIDDMLRTVENQRLRDFEVIIVNDGSTDGSQEIIDKYVSLDNRFKSFIQENGGVSLARNHGISKASGEYVVFYDPDDKIPLDALSKMYEKGKKMDADIVVGVMKEYDLGQPKIYMHSQRLAKQDKISPLDESFFGAWSICNKMFKLSFLKENQIYFRHVKHSEDGVFTFDALNKTDKITGCDVVSYNYVKRPFWLESSATQKISADYLADLIKSQEIIMEDSREIAMRHLPIEKVDKHLETLYIRFMEVGLIGGFYRQIWRGNSEVIELLKETIAEYKTHISEESYQQLIARQEDLDIGSFGYMQKAEMARKPLVSIIVTGEFSKDQMQAMIKSLYYQNFPRFEIVMQEKDKEKVSRDIVNLENIKFVDTKLCKDKLESVEQLLGESSGSFYLFAEEYFISTKETLKTMYQMLRGGKSAFVSVMPKNMDGKEVKDIPLFSGIFSHFSKGKFNYKKEDSLDFFLSNKLIKRSGLTREILEKLFKDSTTNKGEVLYKSLSSIRTRRGFVIMDMDEARILENAGVRKTSLSLKIKGSLNNGLGNAKEKAKRVIDKDQAKKIKKLLKR